jgi:3',5'-cyclic-AMP phosphodiesterase
MNRWKPRASHGALIAGFIALSCLDVARQRAEDDELVGRAEAAGWRVVVAEGHAVVSALEPQRIALRAQAPSLDVTLDGPGGFVTLEIENALPAAQLQVLAGGTSFSVGGELATSKKFELQLGPGESVLRLAPPDLAAREPFRFALLADVQEALPRVGDVYRRINQDPTVRFVVFSGDLTEQGSEAEIREFIDRQRELGVPLYATLGNHELGSSELWFQRLIGRCNTSFSYHGTHFTLLDSASATIDPVVYDRLDGWLAAGRDEVHVVAMHIPPHDPVGTRNGAFASRAEAAKLLATLAEARVDLTLYGHVHSYYSFVNAGIPAHVSGGGGAIQERFDGVQRHFLTVDVDPDRGVTQTGLVRVD